MPFKKLIAKLAESAFVTNMHRTHLKPGDKAPPVKGILQDGSEFDPKTVSGKKVILYFYPKDDTAGCTTEACNLRDNYKEMLRRGFFVIGVSPDSPEKHRRFIEKYHLPFPLISDPELKLIKAFDVWGKKQFLGRIFDGLIRSTFVIDKNGTIEEVIEKVDSAGHARQLLKD
jgi:thioredoxin-dependent peroxiredoxin